MVTPPSIVVAHASVGSGHRIAAEAVAERIEALTEGAVRVELVDALDYGAFKGRGDSLAGAFTGPTAKLYDVAWRSELLGRTSTALGGPLMGALYKRFTERLFELKPVAVVATHALPASLAVRARKAGLRCPVAAVSTDFGAHTYWPRTGLDLFCVADEPTAEQLLARGLDRRRIAVTGVPVRQQFTQPVDRMQAREALDLPLNRRTLLALAGASMPGPYRHFKDALATSLPALASLPHTTLVVVTGRDEAYATQLKARAAGFGSRTVHVHGYVEEIGQLMAAADLAICKPGGLVCAECLDMGLPMVLVGPSVGQEFANVKALSGAGAAAYAAEARQLSEVTRRVLASQPRLRSMQTAAADLARPDAAAHVASRVLALLK